MWPEGPTESAAVVRVRQPTKMRRARASPVKMRVDAVAKAACPVGVALLARRLCSLKSVGAGRLPKNQLVAGAADSIRVR